MRRYWSLLGTGLLGLMAAGVILAQSKTGNQQTGDVFSSGGGADDRRKYVSPDGRNFDRCAYDTANIPNLPDTKMYGMPDHVPIDSAVMRQYERCAVDACAVNQKAVCWGKNGSPKPSGPPLSPDSFNTNGFSNCKVNGSLVVCDLPPKLLEILPAICLAQQGQQPVITCQAKTLLKIEAKINVGQTTGYNDKYGKQLPAMSGQTSFQKTTLYVNVPAGFLVGQGLAGPVKVQSLPRRFSSAAGYIDSVDPSGKSAVLIITDLRDLKGSQVLDDGQTISVGVGIKR
jgi:hypothetical protein